MSAPGRQPSAPEEKRSLVKSFSVTESEDEILRWASKELGLELGSFLRFAALKLAKKVTS